MKAKKIVITGPESVGKTTLAGILADHFGVPWVPEFARTFLENLQRPYVQDDLLEIAKGQIQAEDNCKTDCPFFLLDTNLLTIKIWSEFRFGNCNSWISSQIASRNYDLYLLCKPDIKWTPDPQREHPHLRNELFVIYKNNLDSLGANYLEISGEGQQRTNMAIEFLTNFL